MNEWLTQEEVVALHMMTNVSASWKDFNEKKSVNFGFSNMKKDFLCEPRRRITTVEKTKHALATRLSWITELDLNPSPERSLGLITFPNPNRIVVGDLVEGRWRRNPPQDQAKGDPAIGTGQCHTLRRLSHGARGEVGSTAVRRREGHFEVLG